MKRPLLRPQDLAVLRGIFHRFPWVQEACVFGSRATGLAGRASDLDLAVSAPEASAAQWLDLKDAIEEAPIIYELDLVRTEQTENPRLLEKIKREGVSIYPESRPPD